MKQSPTLLLGQVFRAFIRARAFKTTATDGSGRPLFRPAFMPYLADNSAGLDAWRMMCDPTLPANAAEMVSIATFVQRVGLTNDHAGMIKYNASYASDIAVTPYNSSLAFMATRNQDANPLHFFGGNAFADLMKTNPLPSANSLNQIPSKFQVLQNVTSLAQMQPFFDGLGVPGKRASWKIDPAAEGSTILDSLKKRGLLKGKKLDLNGWVYFEGENQLNISENLEVVSNGGIVLQKGNITVQNQIKAQNGVDKLPVLYLVTKNGDININYNGTIDAAFMAKGKINIGNGGRPTITGALAMGRFDVSSASQGADLDYNTNLAAKPDIIDRDEGSEAPLLGISFAPSLEFL